MNKYIIYALAHPISNEIRYIGRSSNGLQRPKHHMSISTLKKSRLPVHNWIRALKKDNLQPSVVILAEWPHVDNETLNNEEIKQIEKHTVSGKLLNLTKGGDGCLGRSISSFQRQAITKSNQTRQYSKETLELMSRSAKARRHHKPMMKVLLSDGRVCIGLRDAATALGCSISHVSLMIKHKLCYNNLRAFNASE